MEKDTELFGGLLSIFYSSCMVALGKIKNPASDKIERNLEQAKQAIDMLEMIRNISKGNLDEQQKRTLDNILTDLRLNFVDERNKDSVSS
jgi:hypothetical protein